MRKTVAILLFTMSASFALAQAVVTSNGVATMQGAAVAPVLPSPPLVTTPSIHLSTVLLPQSSSPGDWSSSAAGAALEQAGVSTVVSVPVVRYGDQGLSSLMPAVPLAPIISELPALPSVPPAETAAEAAPSGNFGNVPREGIARLLSANKAPAAVRTFTNDDLRQLQSSNNISVVGPDH